MKIGIFAGNLVAFHAKSLDERALGGTETGVIRLSQSLHELGHEVMVFTSLEQPPGSQPQYFHISQAQDQAPFDVFISVRDWIPCFYEVQAKKTFFWTGDSYDQFPNYGLGDKRVIEKIDAFLAVSDWQAKEISSRSGYPYEKCFVLKNGIEPSFFEGEEDRKRKRLIYSSTPYRGLSYVPILFQTLYSKHPDLELHVFSGYQVYDQSDEKFKELRESLSQLPNTTVHGNILQKDLAREFMKSSLLFYPCIFEETSCITAIEAMAAGCVPVTTALGALPETIADAGILVEGLPNDQNYIKSFLEQSHRLLSDDQLWQELSQRGKNRAQDYSWKKIAKNLESFIQRQLES